MNTYPSSSPSSDWAFYLIGILLLSLGVAFILIPLVGRSLLSNMKIPWFILYVYNKGGFYFVTSPLLIIISLIGIVIAVVIRR